jgi:hypothetical protein
MSIETFPVDILPTSLSFKLMPNSGFNKANNNMVEVWTRQGAYWMFTANFSRVRYANARRIRNLIDSLDGSVGEFMMWDSTHTQLGNWAGTIKVKGGSQTGTALDVDGATPSAVIAPRGDRFQLGEYLYVLTEDAVADASGACELRFLPQLMSIPSDNELLISTNPMCKMMLPDNNQGPDFASRSLVLTDFSVKGFMSMRS